MGTSGSYSGSGGKLGRDVRSQAGDWLEDLLSSRSQSGGATAQQPNPQTTGVIAYAIDLLLSGDGSAGTGAVPRGGAQRSIQVAARSAGRAAAGGYAYVTGNQQVLEELGLNYDELRELRDPLEVTCRIVNAACGAISEGTIENGEQRSVAAGLADWLLSEQESGNVLQPDDIARKAIALMVFETISSEIGDLIRSNGRPAWLSEVAENDLREGAEVLADQAELSVNGVTDTEFANAIENGIKTFRDVLGWRE